MEHRVRHNNALDRPRRVKSGPDSGRVDVSEPASISSGIAQRYATAVFELANEGEALSALEANLDDLAAALDGSDDLKDLISSPVYARAAQEKAIVAVAGQMGLMPVLQNVLALMAQKRRLFVLPAMITQLRAQIAAHKGEVTADVTAAQALSDAQTKALAEQLKASVGKDVKVNVTVDESLIGGLVVKVGSKMIDTSIRAKLNSLQNVMKEVG
jgi:F-type H+-transporting ATPase subunit delta